MKTLGEILVDVGAFSLLLGYFGIGFCAFAVSLGRGLLSLVFPFIGFGVAMRRFPWIIWLWLGGVALVVLGGVLS